MVKTRCTKQVLRLQVMLPNLLCESFDSSAVEGVSKIYGQLYKPTSFFLWFWFVQNCHFLPFRAE